MNLSQSIQPSLAVKYGVTSKYIHKLRWTETRKRWLDCNGWERQPYDDKPTETEQRHLCPKCFKQEVDRE